MKVKRTITGAVAIALVLTLVGCSNSSEGDAGGSIELSFFQSKPESVGVVNELIKEFEQAHPGVKIVQDNAPEPETALQSRLAKNAIPDIVAVNISNYYDVARNEILMDLTGTDALAAVDDKATLEYVSKAGQTKEPYAVPWSTNAQVVLYNIDKFESMGLTVPTTWTEMIDVSAKIKSAGETPFFFTWKDAWTAMLLFNTIGGNLAPANFWDELKDGSNSFSKESGYKETADKLLELKKYGQTDPFGKGYNDGNAGFASGESVMYVQGTWTLPEILATNPDINVGAFVMPVTDSPEDTKILSGPDSVIGVSKTSAHQKEALEFLDFLMSKEAQQKYTDQQHLFSVRSDVAPVDTVLLPLKQDWIDKGKVAGYPNGMFSASADLIPLCQEYMQGNQSSSEFLKAIDADWQQNGVK